MNEYPEHEKLSEVKKVSQGIGEFVEWLRCEKSIELCNIQQFPDRVGILCEGFRNGFKEDVGDKEDPTEDQYWPINIPIEKLLAEYFKINSIVLENEKRSMLDEQRRLNEK